MFRKKKKNYREIFNEAFEHLSDIEKNQVIELSKQMSALAEKHHNIDPNTWRNMEDTIYAFEISNKIKSIVFRDRGAVPPAEQIRNSRGSK